MKMAINWLTDSHHTSTVLICSDSQALLRAIDNSFDTVTEIINMLDKAALSRMSLQWVPDHCGIPGNE